MQIILHWLIAALVALQFLLAEGIETLWRDRMTGAIPNEAFPTPHTVTGFAILVLMLWRLVLRLRHGAPPPPAGEAPALARVAQATHALFYLLLIGMPVSGAIAWFGGLRLPAEAHGVAASVLLVLVVLHVAAALAHQFWWKTDVLRRMTRG
jgi:cytochrome b561